MIGKTMKHLLPIFILLFAFAIQAEGVHSKAYSKRIELLKYLREIEPMVRNFRGKSLKEKDNKDAKDAPLDAKGDDAGERIRRYEDIKRLYQEGTIYYFEGIYVNSYKRLLDAQLEMEQLLEEFSQFYIERTEDMLKAAADKKSDSKPEDKTLVDVSVEFGKKSKVEKFHKAEREAPLYVRTYNPKEYHYVLNKKSIEENLEKGYRTLGEAKQFRLNGLKIEKSLEPKANQKLLPQHRKIRIENYFASIKKSKDAKANAMHIFRLKYPYDSNYLMNDGKTKLEGVSMEYRENPFVKPKNLDPVFDLSVPKVFRRDVADVKGMIFDEAIDEKLKIKYSPIVRDTKLKPEIGEDSPDEADDKSAKKPEDTAPKGN